MTRKPASIPTTDTTQDLPGVTSSPAQSGAVVAVVAPAAAGQGETPKSRFIGSDGLMGALSKLLQKTEPNSPQFLIVLDALIGVRKTSASV